MIWGDGTATEAMLSQFEVRGYSAKPIENGLAFEVYRAGETSRRKIVTATPLAVLWCPLRPGDVFQWITPELVGRDPREVPLAAWCDLLPYVTEESVPFEVARDVVETLTPVLTSTGGR